MKKTRKKTAQKPPTAAAEPLEESVRQARASYEAVYAKLLALIRQGRNIFVTGGAGVGKSYTLNRLREVYKNTLHVTSTTGISAINVRGQTLHSWAGIGIADKPVGQVVRAIKLKPTLYKMLLCCKILAIDEISMLQGRILDYTNAVLKRIRESNKPFGGIQVLFFGDYFQLPPVGKDADNKKDFCFNCDAWKELAPEPVVLKDVLRQADKCFSDALNKVRVDEADARHLRLFYERDIPYHDPVPDDVLQIFATNDQADAHNRNCFEALTGKIHAFKAQDFFYTYTPEGRQSVHKLCDLKEHALATAMAELKDFNDQCKAPEKLELKVGARVMLLRNLDVAQGLANGSCGTVQHLTNNAIRVRFDNGASRIIEMEDFEYIKAGQTRIMRKQFPLRLAYGITIHKSQGMTYDRLMVDFGRIFDYGQAYVALSRTRTLDGLIIKGFDHNKIVANAEVKAFYATFLPREAPAAEHHAPLEPSN